MRPAAHQPAAAGAWLAVAGLAIALAGFGAATFGGSGVRIAVLLVIAPLVEESLFRAGLHEGLLRRQWVPWAANLATALAFGAVHVLVRADVHGWLVVVPSLVIGQVYGMRRRLRDCVVLHAAMNALWLGWTLLAPLH
ncbi:MAG TPA: JDVT-CTERM system glutamic-type intramembrane protease [Albitalea sp.]|nr:JDVT-CTERM system glutamic-type intramembrane protease [Albitalea sp.]